MIESNRSLRIIITSMLNATPEYLSVLLVVAVVISIYAIAGITLFKGSFKYCLTENLENEKGILDKFDCMDHGGDWVNKPHNFDDFGNAFKSLFTIMTTSGWLDVMWDSVDAVGIDMVP